jgi:hypothetical protein
LRTRHSVPSITPIAPPNPTRPTSRVEPRPTASLSSTHAPPFAPPPPPLPLLAGAGHLRVAGAVQRGLGDAAA